MSQKFKSEVQLEALNNATTDTDKFLVSDGGIIKYRTGSEMLSDLGVAPGVASNIQHQVKAGVAINKGQAVYVTSADGTNMIVGLASNASEATSSKTMGLMASTVSTNGFGNVIAEGLLAGLNTNGATAGDPVWLGIGGNLIYGLTNKPYAPAHLVFIGIVTRVNSNNGEIFVKVQNGFELDELHDVDLKTTTPLNGHLLGFNGTLWVNKTIAGWLGFIPANASGTTNYVSKFTGSTSLGDSQIFDNGTNVGIGTSSPATKLTVEGILATKPAGVDAYYSYLKSNWSADNAFELGISAFGSSFYHKLITSSGYYNGETLQFWTNDTERARFDISGNFGIGTINPSQKLEINGTAYASSDFRAPIFYDSGNTGFYLDGGNSSSGGWRLGTPSGVIDFGPLNSYHAHVYTDRPNFYFNKELLINGANVLYESAWINNKYFATGGEIYSTIYYDANDSAYYLNPASTSNLNGLTVANTITGSVSGNAGTATTLQTARTINGTSFNGSANIETSYWGATRTLTIGNTGKTVNGSGNQSWSLAEIGAQPAGSYLTSETDTLQSVTNRGATTNLAITSPNYVFTGASSGAIGLVTSTSSFGTRSSDGTTYGYGISTNINGGLDIMANQSGQPIRFWAGTTNVSPIQRMIISAGDVTATDSFRAPVFYDSNNTGYYVDAASTSVLNGLTLASYSSANNGFQAFKNIGTTTPSWPDTNHTLGLENSDAGHLVLNFHRAGYTSNNLVYDGSFFSFDLATKSSADFRAPVFYDLNNTSYYLDPAGTSNLLGLTVVNTITGNITGNAGSASSVAWGNVTGKPTLLQVDGFSSDLNSSIGDDTIYWTPATSNAPSQYGSLLNITGGISWYNQLGFTTGDSMVFRQSINNTTSWTAWKTILHSSNIGSYAAPISHTHTFDSLTSKTGGTGTYTTSGDFRAPIFYDSDNTGYYVDPNNTSNLNIVRAANRLTGAWIGVDNTSATSGNGISLYNGATSGQPTYGMMFAGTGTFGTHGSVGGADWATYLTMSDNTTRGWIFRRGSTNVASISGAGILQTDGYIYSSNYVQAGNSMYSPIYYDAINTSYYLDPNGTSNLYSSSFGDGANSNQGIDIKYANGPGLYGRIRFYQGSSNNSTIHSFSSLWQNGTLQTASSGAINLDGETGITIGAWNNPDLWVDRNGIAQARNSLRSPIFYDSNNTGYYVDPTSTTQINNLRLSSLDSAMSWTDNAYMLGSPTTGFRFNDSASNINALIIDNSGNTFAYASHRAPVFYDSNNTAYYTDPSATSSLYNLTLSGAKNTYLLIGPGNGYEAMVRYNGGSGSSWYVGKRTANQTVNTSDFHFYSEAAGMSVAGIDVSGNIFATQSIRTGVFYDLDDTNYYVNPAGSTRINNGNFAGNCSWFGGYGGGSGPGLGFENQGSFARMAFWGLDFWDWNSGSAMTIDSGYVLASGSFRAPIFYDSNDTSYYFDGSSTGDSIRCAGDIVAYYSDERLKDKKGNIENALEKVLSLNGFYYEPNEVAQELGYKKRLEVGVSAQEVEAVLPEIIKDAPIGGNYKTLDYGRLTPLLIEAVKEQQIQISEQQKQIEELKELVNKLINK